MLSRANRFHGHSALKKVYKLGRPVRGRLFSLHVSRQPVGGVSKCAVVVSRKVDGSAVVRNRIRRRLYEQIRLQLPNFSEAAFLIITVYSAEIQTMASGELAREVRALLVKAGLLA